MTTRIYQGELAGFNLQEAYITLEDERLPGGTVRIPLLDRSLIRGLRVGERVNARTEQRPGGKEWLQAAVPVER